MRKTPVFPSFVGGNLVPSSRLSFTFPRSRTRLQGLTFHSSGRCPVGSPPKRCLATTSCPTVSLALTLSTWRVRPHGEGYVPRVCPPFQTPAADPGGQLRF